MYIHVCVTHSVNQESITHQRIDKEVIFFRAHEMTHLKNSFTINYVCNNQKH